MRVKLPTRPWFRCGDLNRSTLKMSTVLSRLLLSSHIRRTWFPLLLLISSYQTPGFTKILRSCCTTFRSRSTRPLESILETVLVAQPHPAHLVAPAAVGRRQAVAAAVTFSRTLQATPHHQALRPRSQALLLARLRSQVPTEA